MQRKFVVTNEETEAAHLENHRKEGKKTKVTVENKVVELQEDRYIFAHMMMICKSRPEINIPEAVGVYGFSFVPRSLFTADGSM